MGLMVRNLPAKTGGDIRNTGLIPGSGRSPERGKWQPNPVFLPEKFHGQGEPGGLQSMGYKELDMT